MAIPGPKPKPRHLKAVEGNPGKRALKKRDPKPKGGPPGCPTWLPTEGKAEWRRQIAANPTGLITEADRAALAAYCARWAVFVSATRALHTRATGGILVKGYRGQRVKNVLLQIQRDAAADVKSFAAEFGFTPSSRSRIEMPEDPAKTDAAGIMRPTRVREQRPPGR
jgi:P27 family predicted phage terminase small subunit